MESTKSRQKFTETVEVFRLAALPLVFLQVPMVEMVAEVVGCRFPERESKTLRLDVQLRVRPVLLRIPAVRVRELKNTLMKLQWILQRVR
jgi:hypothetical protein